MNSSSGLVQELPTCILHAASCWWGYGIGVWQGVGQEPDRSLEIGAQLEWVYCMIRRLGFILHVAQRHQWLISMKKNQIKSVLLRYGFSRRLFWGGNEGGKCEESS